MNILSREKANQGIFKFIPLQTFEAMLERRGRRPSKPGWREGTVPPALNGDVR